MWAPRYGPVDEEAAKGRFGSIPGYPGFAGLSAQERSSRRVRKNNRHFFELYGSVIVVGLIFIMVINVAFLVLLTKDMRWNPLHYNCRGEFGKYVNGDWQGREPTYNFTEILMMYGGLPGALHTRNEREIELNTEISDIDDDKSLTKYTLWNTSFARRENVIHQKNNETFEEIRGKIFFRIPNGCTVLRYAEYEVNELGFQYNLTRHFCYFGSPNLYNCILPAQCVSLSKGDEYCLPPQAEVLSLD